MARRYTCEGRLGLGSGSGLGLGLGLGIVLELRLGLELALTLTLTPTLTHPNPDPNPNPPSQVYLVATTLNKRWEKHPSSSSRDLATIGKHDNWTSGSLCHPTQADEGTNISNLLSINHNKPTI